MIEKINFYKAVKREGVMDLDESYELPGFELEASVRETYHQGIRRLRETQDPQDCFEILRPMFEALGISHPGPNKGIEWAKELIQGYRNLGRILNELSGFKFISEIASKYSGLLDDYEGKNPIESIESALEELRDISDVLKDQGIETEGLEARLELASEAEELREKINGLESL